jgi:hypothetical protein
MLRAPDAFTALCCLREVTRGWVYIPREQIIEDALVFGARGNVTREQIEAVLDMTFEQALRS